MKSFNVFRKRPLPQDPRDPKTRNRRELQNREDRSQEQGNRLAEILDLNRGGKATKARCDGEALSAGSPNRPAPILIAFPTSLVDKLNSLQRQRYDGTIACGDIMSRIVHALDVCIATDISRFRKHDIDGGAKHGT